MDVKVKIDKLFDDAALQADPRTDAPVHIAQIRALVQAYLVHYAADGWKPVSVEQEFELPIKDIATRHNLLGKRYNKYSGKIDAIVEDAEGKLLLVDHKTASKVDANYWQALKTESQVSQYFMALWQMGIKVDKIVWDVICKTKAAPKAVTKKAIKEYNEFGTYLGVVYPHNDFGVEPTESLKMYSHRIFVTALSEPHKFFIRREIIRTPDQIKEYLREMNLEVHDINSLTEDTAIRNLSGCKAWGSLCEYHPICSGEDPDKEMFKRKPEDAGHKSNFSKDAISDSTLKDYRRCKKRLWLRKLERIVPKYEKYEAGLTMGDLFHKAIEMALEDRPQSEIKLEFKGNLLNV